MSLMNSMVKLVAVENAMQDRGGRALGFRRGDKESLRAVMLTVYGHVSVQEGEQQ